MRTLQTALLTITLLFSSSCKESPDPQYNFIGKWQSLNDSTTAIIIDSLYNYDLQIDSKSLISDIEDFQELSINIKATADNWFEFELRDRSGKEFSKGKIEIVDKSRIRMYHHKHSDILDVADEYYRVVENESFEVIMSKFMN